MQSVTPGTIITRDSPTFAKYRDLQERNAGTRYLVSDHRFILRLKFHNYIILHYHHCVLIKDGNKTLLKKERKTGAADGN